MDNKSAELILQNSDGFVSQSPPANNELILQNSDGVVSQSPPVHNELVVQNSANAVSKICSVQIGSTELILRGFLEVVSQMRTAQKEYFRTRNKTALFNSINLEKQIDTFISEFLKSNHNTNAKENNS
jgi:hypothetical protein